METNHIIFLVAIIIAYYFFSKTGLVEKFTEFVVQHGVAVTNPPPQLAQKPVPWGDSYTRHSKRVHDIYHSNVLVNAFPMGKPPSLMETTSANEESVDVARAQFIPKMAKRTS